MENMNDRGYAIEPEFPPEDVLQLGINNIARALVEKYRDIDYEEARQIVKQRLEDMFDELGDSVIHEDK